MSYCLWTVCLELHMPSVKLAWLLGEPPTAKGYPPSVFSLLPKLIERSGTGRAGEGTITAMYTLLAEGDDLNDPIVDIARASLDGQVVLSRALADAAHYPAIDLMGRFLADACDCRPGSTESSE